MRERLLLIAVIVLSIVISTYLIYTRNSLEQNEEFFHSKMLASLKDVPQGFYLVEYKTRSIFDPTFFMPSLFDEIEKLKWERGYAVVYSNIRDYLNMPQSVLVNSIDFRQSYSIYSMDNIDAIIKILQSKNNFTIVNPAAIVTPFTYTREDVPEEGKSIGDYNTLFVGNGSLGNESFRIINFYFIKGRIFQLISMSGPSDSVSINETIRFAKTIENIMSPT